MSILTYFKKQTNGKTALSGLPDPMGPLSSKVPLGSITAANKEVERLMARKQPAGTRGTYLKLNEKQKADIAAYAVENGGTSAVRHFNKTLNVSLNESSVRMWVGKYKEQQQKLVKAGETDLRVKTIPSAKRGRPLLLGNDLDAQAKEYIRALRDEGSVITVPVTMAVGTAIVESSNRMLLAKNEGSIEITKSWARSLLYRMNFVKRRGGSTRKIAVANFDELKEQYLLDIQALVLMEEIPFDLILNWDQTGLHIVPGCQWTMEEKGCKRVELVGIDDKRQITTVICGSLTGELLPFQLIYTGITQACLPKVAGIPDNWHVTCTRNHWSNEEKMKDYLNVIIFPYIRQKRKDLGLADDHPALVIFDVFKGQTTDAIYDMLEENHILWLRYPQTVRIGYNRWT